MRTRNARLRNYVVIGNDDAMDLGGNVSLFDISNRRVKDIKVEYVWFTVEKNGFFALLTSTNKIWILLANT